MARGIAMRGCRVGSDRQRQGNNDDVREKSPGAPQHNAAFVTHPTTLNISPKAGILRDSRNPTRAQANEGGHGRVQGTEHPAPIAAPRAACVSLTLHACLLLRAYEKNMPKHAEERHAPVRLAKSLALAFGSAF